jgi:DNA-binding CsgD family transcriptional regulator/tetratricopeptide (TPR) repeat protein
MIPTAVGPRADVLRLQLGVARIAWRRGDYDDCLSALEIVPERLGPANELIADGLLLRSRARLRTNRAPAVIEELGSVLEAFNGLNEACTARMLYGAAVARVVDPHHGIALLDAVHDAARKAHPSIRAEICYYKALTLWTLHRYEEADTLAQKTEAARADILSVRATELRAYCAIALERGIDALELFRSAHAAYNKCHDRDALLIAKIVLQTANLEQSFRSAKVLGSHATPSSRTFVGDRFWRAKPSFERMRTLQMDGWLYALDGDGPEAFRCLHEAEKMAPSSSWKVAAIANRGLLAAWFDEPLSAAQHVTVAEAEARSVHWLGIGSREELVCLFALIEAMCAVGTPPLEMMKIYDRAAASIPMDTLSAESTNASFEARVDYLRGLVRRSVGDAVEAHDLLSRAYRRFRSAGCLWRAALALIELDATSAPGTVHGDFYLETAALLVREHFPNSFLTSRLGCWGNAYRDPIARKLTPAQREVLRYALDGHGAMEIASLCGRAEKTVRKHLTALHEAFGAETTLRLVAVCHARGLGSPAWRSQVGVTSETG